MFRATAAGHRILSQRSASRQSAADTAGRAGVSGLWNDGRSTCKQEVREGKEQPLITRRTLTNNLTYQFRFGLIGSVLGLVNKDISMVITNMKELEFFPPDTDTTLMINALNNALMNSTEGGSASSLNFTRLNQNLEAISDLIPFRLPPFYTLIIRSLTILEGLAVFVDPSFRLIRGAYPFIARQILTNPSPEMTKLLQSLIVTSDGRIRWDKLEQFISISANADAAVQGNFQALKVQ